MALVTTTLTAPINSTKISNIALASTTGFAAGQAIKIDSEYAFTVSVNPGFGITVRMRGAEGSAAAAHDVGAVVVTSPNPADFPNVPTGNLAVSPPAWDDQATIGADVTLSPPTKNTTYNITKGSACNITLNSGTAAQAGVVMTFISNTAFAHVITYAAGFLGGANTVATFTAKTQASLMLEVGLNGLLAVIGGSDNVTFTL